MIVKSAAFEGDRTVWKFELEADDDAVPRNELWVDGFVRGSTGDVEALWLGLALGPFAGGRLVLPNPVAASLQLILKSEIGCAVSAPTRDRQPIATSTEFSAVLVRDVLDAMLSSIARKTATHRIAVHSDPGQSDEISTPFRIATNAGSLRRYRAPLDFVGELAAILLHSPGLSLGRVDAFLCREELGDLDRDRLTAAAAACGVELWLPLSNVSARELGGALLQLGCHPVVSFKGLWRRYRAFPKVMGSIYRDLETVLNAYAFDDPALRIARHFATSSSAPSSRVWQKDCFATDFYC